MADNFNIKFYYNNNRISPCPKISIETRPQYANDNIIGYDYLIKLTGYATAIDVVTDEYNSGLNLVVSKIDDIREIFSANGKDLRVTNKNGTDLIKARGGIVRNITFNQTDNFWVNYCEYSIDIVFSEITYTGCDETVDVSCSGDIKHLLNSNNGYYGNKLIDLDKYKIASFQDEWSFELADTVYNTFDEFENQHFNLEYKINATGRTYFNEGATLPAWEMAKNFCQDKLHRFVNSLIKGILSKSNENNDGCSPSYSLDEIHEEKDKCAGNGVLALECEDYGIFNEKITCETSQSDGTFSLVYSSIVKKLVPSATIATNNSLHTFNINKSITNDNANKNTSISIQGNIQGLIPGGIINNPNVIELPQNGMLFVHNNPNENTPTKYDYALEAYNKIVANSKDDLNDDFKQKLGITNSSLGITCNPNNYPTCASHSVSHSYGDGIISYTTDFNNKIACIVGSNPSNSIRNVVVTQNDPRPRIAEYVVPGRSLGPIIQRIGTDEPRTISIRIEGVNRSLQCCFSPDAIIDEIANQNFHRYLPNDLPPEEIPYLILTQNSYTASPLDGSFFIQREYICCDANALLG